MESVGGEALSDSSKIHEGVVHSSASKEKSGRSGQTFIMSPVCCFQWSRCQQGLATYHFLHAASQLLWKQSCIILNTDSLNFTKKLIIIDSVCTEPRCTCFKIKFTLYLLRPVITFIENSFLSTFLLRKRSQLLSSLPLSNSFKPSGSNLHMFFLLTLILDLSVFII